jgi:MYXO-CTERM domain-containing protein
MLATALLVGTSLLGTDISEAQPAPPATFVGTVTIDGDAVADGTPVLALVKNDKVCGKSSREPGQEGTWTLEEDIDNLGMHSGDSIYIIDVASDSQTPGCGTEGATVTFQVDGEPANEQGLWKAGLNTLNLTVGQAPAPDTTPDGQTPNTADGDTESSFQWWMPAAGGGGAVILLGLAAVIWRRRRQV